MTLSMIAAMSENRVIGRNGDMPWSLPTDMAHFKRTTMGHPIIMGRRTFASFGCRPLPGRTNIVLTRSADEQDIQRWTDNGVRVVHDLADALAIAASDSEPFVIGGGTLYREALPIATRLVLTVIHANIEGDVTFPEIVSDEWTCTERTTFDADDRHAYAMTFEDWRRVKTPVS